MANKGQSPKKYHVAEHIIMQGSFGIGEARGVGEFRNAGRLLGTTDQLTEL